MVFAMWSLMRSPFSTNARTQDSISARCPAGRSSNWYLPLLLYENRSAKRFIGDSSHVPTPLPMKYFSISSYLIFLCLPMSISPHMTRISVGTGTKYTPDVSTTASTIIRRTRRALHPPRRGPGERRPLPVRPAHECEPARGEPVARQNRAENSDKGAGNDVAGEMRVNGDPAHGDHTGIDPHRHASARPNRADRKRRREGRRAVTRGHGGIVRPPGKRHKVKRSPIRRANAPDQALHDRHRQPRNADGEEHELEPHHERQDHEIGTAPERGPRQRRRGHHQHRDRPQKPSGFAEIRDLLEDLDDPSRKLSLLSDGPGVEQHHRRPDHDDRADEDGYPESQPRNDAASLRPRQGPADKEGEPHAAVLK